MPTESSATDLETFLRTWEDTPQQTKKAFLRLKDHLEKQPQTTLSFKSRPGVSHSLRAKHDRQSQRELFVMADVIDDDPANRWLSVCFYGEMISDPEEKGDLVPEGLLGEDGYCFDIDAWDETELRYVEARLDEAHASASQGD